MALEVDRYIWKYLVCDILGKRGVERVEFKEHNSVSKRSMFPWRSRNHRQSERGELSLGSSMCKLESLSLRKVLTVKKKTKKHTSIELPRSTLPGKVPFSLWFHGDPNESTVCPRVHEGPLYLLFTSLHGRKPQKEEKRGENTNCLFKPVLWIVRD